MPVRNMPSKVPAPPVDATGAPRPRTVEVGEISADQRAEAATDIGKRRGVLAREYHCNDGGHQDGHEYRHRDAKAGNGIGHPMARAAPCSSRRGVPRTLLAVDAQLQARAQNRLPLSLHPAQLASVRQCRLYAGVQAHTSVPSFLPLLTSRRQYSVTRHRLGPIADARRLNTPNRRDPTFLIR
jgi:hypothetical protein